MIRRICRLLRNAWYDLRIQGRYLGGGRASQFADRGAVDVQNSDYAALPHLFMHPLAKSWWTRPPTGDDPKIVDIGCGRGRVINWLIAHGVKDPIIGLELEPAIAAQTAANLTKYPQVQIQQGDALQLLPDDATLIYMYNPFCAKTVDQLRQVIESRYAHRPLLLIYNYDLHVQVFQHHPHWTIQPVPLPPGPGMHHSAILQWQPPNHTL